MAEKTIANRSQQSMTNREETRSQEQYVTPPVDIYETKEGLVVKADLPGVAKDSLDVRVEKSVGKAGGKRRGLKYVRYFQVGDFFDDRFKCRVSRSPNILQNA